MQSPIRSAATLLSSPSWFLLAAIFIAGLLIHSTATAEEYAPIVALWRIGKKPVFLQADEQKRFFAILNNMKQVSVSGKSRQTDMEFCFWKVRQIEHSLAQSSFLVYDDGSVYGWRLGDKTRRQLATLIRELLDRSK